MITLNGEPINGILIEGSTKKYFLNGLIHRYNGPAIEFADGTKEWYQHGKLHRTDGPAIEYINGDKEWWLNDQKYGFDTRFNIQSWLHLQKILLF